MDSSIQFFSHEMVFDLPRKEEVALWLERIIRSNKRIVGVINYIFTTDEYVLSLNKTHLSHDYYTDILTFPMDDEDPQRISADIYISLDRVNDNATSYGVNQWDELHRVMIHGVLHLLGYNDHGEKDLEMMRNMENEALKLRDFTV